VSTKSHEEGLPSAGDETFLRRWSRRKQAAGGDHPTSNDPFPPEPVPAPQSPPAPVLTDEDMPPIESLTPESDFSGFMSPGVSEGLRQRALRVLFRSPQLNARCPLDSEYYDCANMTPLGSIITHEMREEMEREAEKKLAALGHETIADEADTAGSAGAGGEQAAPARGEDPATPRNGQAGENDA
jgi:hypothetical protein